MALLPVRDYNVLLLKRSPAFQFKTPWWQIEGSSTYYKKNRIPQNWELVE